MSRTVATRQQELDFLAALIGAEAEGMGLDAISQKLGGTHQRRTLQRRLALLVAQERIEMMGDRRGARYRANPAQSRSTNQPARAEALAQAPTAVYVPTSVEGAEVRAYVNQPRQLRTPVAYQLDFLEQYHPNHTCYLPPNLREQLHGLGQSAAHRHPAGTFARDMLNRLLIDLSWASSHLEGNTYSRLDTERLIEYGQAAEGKEAFETQ